MRDSKLVCLIVIATVAGFFGLGLLAKYISDRAANQRPVPVYDDRTDDERIEDSAKRLDSKLKGIKR